MLASPMLAESYRILLDNPEDAMPTGDEQPIVPRASLEVIQYQVGSLQTSIDRGLASMEKTLEKSQDAINQSLKQQGARLGSIEQTLVAHQAAITALESFREDQQSKERKEHEETRAATARAVDESQVARVWRTLAVVGVGMLSVIGTIIGIIAAVGGFK